MPRKKITDDQPGESKPKTRIVEAITTQKWREPKVVPIEDVEIEPETIELEDDEEEIEYEEIEAEHRTRKSPAVAAKGKFKDALNFMGIGNKEIATLRIDRLLNYKDDGNESLRGAETSYVDKINITPSEIKDEKHLMLLKNYGPGIYRLTLRHGSTNLGIWKEKIDGPLAASPSTRTEGGPSSQVQPAFYPYPQALPQPQKTLVEQLREQAEIASLMRRINGTEGNSAQNSSDQSNRLPEDAQLATILMKDPEFKAKTIKNLIGTVDNESGTLELLLTHAEPVLRGFGTMLSQVIGTTRDAIIQIKRENGGYQNGQAPAGSPQIPQRNDNAGVSMAINGVQGYQGQANETASVQVGAQDVPGVSPSGTANADANQDETSPADYALSEMMNSCSRNIPAKIAAGNLIAFADELERTAPLQSIYGYIDHFAILDFEMIKVLLGEKIVGGKEILALPHAEQWITEFQSLVKPEGDDAQES